MNLRWPLFDGGNRELDLLEANETLSQTELRVTELEKEIRVEVREALLSVETLHAHAGDPCTKRLRWRARIMR